MREDLYEQCSDHMTEKMPSSTRFGSRPSSDLMRSNSSRVRLWAETTSGVIMRWDDKLDGCKAVASVCQLSMVSCAEPYPGTKARQRVHTRQRTIGPLSSALLPVLLLYYFIDRRREFRRINAAKMFENNIRLLRCREPWPATRRSIVDRPRLIAGSGSTTFKR